LIKTAVIFDDSNEKLAGKSVKEQRLAFKTLAGLPLKINQQHSHIADDELRGEVHHLRKIGCASFLGTLYTFVFKYLLVRQRQAKAAPYKKPTK
jgi:hypothetical protein